MLLRSIGGWALLLFLRATVAGADQETQTVTPVMTRTTATTTTTTTADQAQANFPRPSLPYISRGASNYQNTYYSEVSSTSSEWYMGLLKVILGILVLIFIMICLCASVSRAMSPQQTKQEQAAAYNRRYNSAQLAMAKVINGKDANLPDKPNSTEDQPLELGAQYLQETFSDIGSTLTPGMIIPVCERCGLKLRVLAKRINEPQIKQIPTCPVCGVAMKLMSEGLEGESTSPRPNESMYHRRNMHQRSAGATLSANTNSFAVNQQLGRCALGGTSTQSFSRGGNRASLSNTTHTMASDSTSNAEGPTPSDERTADFAIEPPSYDEVMDVGPGERKKSKEQVPTPDSGEEYHDTQSSLEVKVVANEQRRGSNYRSPDWNNMPV